VWAHGRLESSKDRQRACTYYHQSAHVKVDDDAYLNVALASTEGCTFTGVSVFNNDDSMNPTRCALYVLLLPINKIQLASFAAVWPT
jgi:hypothetical protein